MTMLDRMRRHKGWLKWSLGLVVLTFIAFYATDFVNTPTSTIAGTASPNEVVAEIQGRPLTAGEFQRRYLSQMQAYQTAYGGNVNEQLLRQLGIDQQILQQMIDEQAALAEAERQGIRVSDEELAQQIFSIPGLQENGRFIGEARYEQLLRSQRPPMTKGDFEANLRRSMMIDKLRAALTDWMAVAEPELEREYKLRNEKVKLQVVALTADRVPRSGRRHRPGRRGVLQPAPGRVPHGRAAEGEDAALDRDAARAKVNVTPAEAETYYKNNLQQYTTPEQVRASHILLNTAGKDEAAVQKQAEEILKRARAGEDFAALAKQYSEDEGSKVKGGDLDYFARGRMVPEFETAAFNAQPGNDHRSGQVAVRVPHHQGRGQAAGHRRRPLDGVRAQIQDTLAWQRVDQQIGAQSRTARGPDQQPGGPRHAWPARTGLTVVESGFFQRGDPIPGLGAAPAVSAGAFTMADNAVSDALNTPRGPVFITVSGKRDPYMPKLDEVKDRVREDVIRRAPPNSAGSARADRHGVESGGRQLRGRCEGAGPRGEGHAARRRVESALPDVGVSPEVDKVVFTLPAGGVSDPITTVTARSSSASSNATRSRRRSSARRKRRSAPNC